MNLSAALATCLLIYFITINISLAWYTSRNEMPTASTNRDESVSQRLTKTVLIINIYYLTASLPMYISLGALYTDLERRGHLLQHIVTTISYTNCGTNSVIYLLRCKKFYKVLTRFLRSAKHPEIEDINSVVSGAAVLSGSGNSC
jgi:hypothetical protein